MAEENPEAEPAVTTITVQNKTLKSSPFIPGSDQITNGRAWDEWLEGIEREFRYFRITGVEDKKVALIIYGGREIARLEKSLPNPEDAALDNYEKLRKKLNDYFTPRKNKHHARYLFLKMKPNSHETTTSYAARLREKAQDCEFGATCDERILEHLIQTSENQTLIQKAINKSFSLDQFTTEASQVEDTRLQVQEMRPEGATSNVFRIKNKQDKGRGRGFQKQEQEHKCGYCGLTGVHRPGRNCPAFGETCKKCGRKNHFKRMCRTGKTSFKPRQGKHTYKKSVKKTEAVSSETDSSDEECFKSHLSIKVIKKVGSPNKTVPIIVNDVSVHMEPDCGADVNIMDEFQFESLLKDSKVPLQLKHSNCKVNQVQGKLRVKGEFRATVKNPTCGIETKFIVVKGHIMSPPLMGRRSLEELGMLQIRADGSFKTQNSLGTKSETVKSVKDCNNVDNMIEEFKHLFNGVGKISDLKNNKDFPCSLPMKPDAVPVAQKPRQIPYYLQKPLKELIDQGVESDIYERVPTDEPISWCSPLVVQPKPKFKGISPDKISPNMIRASVDMRLPNKSMDRSRVIQSPVVEDFIYKFNDCVMFSKLYMRQGYQQLILDEASRNVTTFSTPWGNYRSKRLIFGAKASQDLFDEAVYRIFGDIPRCLNQRDDILIGGRNKLEHDKTLRHWMKKSYLIRIKYELKMSFNPLYSPLLRIKETIYNRVKGSKYHI